MNGLITTLSRGVRMTDSSAMISGVAGLVIKLVTFLTNWENLPLLGSTRSLGLVMLPSLYIRDWKMIKCKDKKQNTIRACLHEEFWRGRTYLSFLNVSKNKLSAIEMLSDHLSGSLNHEHSSN
jgi:type IV secretory pathway VirB3-like protein